MDTKHFMIWEATRAGMSRASSKFKAAYVDDSIMLISASAAERNEMPPGFVRFLTEEECEAEGISEFVVSEEAGQVVRANLSPAMQLHLHD